MLSETVSFGTSFPSIGGVKIKPLALAISGLLLSTGHAVAEDADPPAMEEVVVTATGTLIRGVAPTGTNVIGMDPGQIKATGAISATEVLQALPQNDSFNDVQFATGASNNTTINRPSLRDIPGGNSGGSPTLVLFDGRRVVGMGVASTTADPDIVPPALIERVEVVADGGSALYGSDAVAGVINFITRKDFEGVQIEARHGSADSYESFDGSITGGINWDGGNAYISLSRSENDALNGDDLGWFKMYPQDQSSLGLSTPARALQCAPGNVSVGGSYYALPYDLNMGAAGTANDCDLVKGMDLYPEVERNSIMFGFNQEVSDGVELAVRGFHMARDISADSGSNFTTVNVSPGDPFYDDYVPDPGTNGQVHSVDVNYGNRIQEIDMETYGIYPTLTVGLANDWQMKLFGSYGVSETEGLTHSAQATAQSNAQAAGLFNPYEPNLSDPEALAAVQNFASYGFSEQELFDVNLIVDGDLFSLPGGEVKLAAGIAYSDQDYKVQKGETVIGAHDTGYSGLTIGGDVIIAPIDALPTVSLDRQVKSAFAELVVPIYGAENARPGIQELTLSLSGRYDDYSDFGDTTNPRFGITWKPVDWLAVRGSWGESFVAPSLANDASTSPSSATFVPGAFLSFLLPPQELIDNGTFPSYVPLSTDTVAVVQGSSPDIESQTATTTSIGFDIQPPAIENLSLSVTWWEVEFEGLIDIPGFTEQQSSWTTFASYKTVRPTQAQIDDLIASVDSTSFVTGNLAEGQVYSIIDVRINNTGDFKTDGLDIGASYFKTVDFGEIDFHLNATYILNREQSAAPGAPFDDLLESDYGKLKATASLGTTIDNFRAQASLRYSDGYDLATPVGVSNQDKVSSYTTLDMFFQYDFKGAGMLEDLSVTLGVNNIFDEEPPEYKVTDTLVLIRNGYANGGTLGRLIQVGFKKTFN